MKKEFDIKDFVPAYEKLFDMKPTEIGGFYYDYAKQENTKFPYVSYPSGHITFLMLATLQWFPKGLKRKDLIEAAFVKMHGQEFYDWKNSGEGRDPNEKRGMRGYWTSLFLAPGQYQYNGGPMYRYCDRNGEGRYVINQKGRDYIYNYVVKHANLVL